MSFGYDEDNAGKKPVAAGKYEVYPTTYEAKLTQNTRNPMITMNYKVRSDVDQASKGSWLQYDNFVDTPNSDWRFNALTKATTLYENKHDFGSMENWAEEMLGKPVLVTVKMQKSNNGQEYPVVSSFAPSKSSKMTETPDVKHHGAMNSAVNDVNKNLNNASFAAESDPFANNGQQVDIDDDSLPF